MYVKIRNSPLTQLFMGFQIRVIFGNGCLVKPFFSESGKFVQNGGFHNCPIMTVKSISQNCLTLSFWEERWEPNFEKLNTFTCSFYYQTLSYLYLTSFVNIAHGVSTPIGLQGFSLPVFIIFIKNLLVEIKIDIDKFLSNNVSNSICHLLRIPDLQVDQKINEVDVLIC